MYDVVGRFKRPCGLCIIGGCECMLAGNTIYGAAARSLQLASAALYCCTHLDGPSRLQLGLQSHNNGPSYDTR